MGIACFAQYSILNLTGTSPLDHVGRSNNSVFDNAWCYKSYSSHTVSPKANKIINKGEFYGIKRYYCSNLRSYDNRIATFLALPYLFTMELPKNFTDVDLNYGKLSDQIPRHNFNQSLPLQKQHFVKRG